MITTKDIETIIHTDSLALGIEETYPRNSVPRGDVEAERVVYYASKVVPEDIWNKCLVYVRVLVRDIDEYGNEDAPRLQELEHLCHDIYKDVEGTYGSESYIYSYDEIGVERDENLMCHYVSVRILFQFLNTLNK